MMNEAIGEGNTEASFLTWGETCVGGCGGGACGALNSNDSCFGLVFLREKDKSEILEGQMGDKLIRP